MTLDPRYAVSRSFRLLVVIVALSGFGDIARASDGVVLRGSVRLDADQLVVCLADVADLSGPIAETLGESIIYETDAAPLRPVTIHLDTIRHRLDADGANLGLLSLSGRECVIRWRAASAPVKPSGGNESVQEAKPAAAFADRYIGEPTLRGVVADYVCRILLRADPANVQLIFRSSDIKAMERPTAGFEFEIKPMASALSPTIPLLVNIYERSAIVATERLTVEVAVRRHVMVVQRYVNRGETLAAEDVVEEMRLVEPNLTNAPSRAADVIGRETRGRLVPGQILRDGDALTPVLVQRNSEVWVRARFGSFMLRLRARALDEGRAGEVVRVRRLSDRMDLTGVVSADGEVAVDIGN